MRKAIVILIIFLLCLFIALYLGKEFLVNKFKTALIESVEKSTPMGLRIDKMSYLPFKGVHLEGIALYRDKNYNTKEFFIPSIYIKFPLLPLLTEKKFSPFITIGDFVSERLAVTGSFAFSVKSRIRSSSFDLKRSNAFSRKSTSV